MTEGKAYMLLLSEQDPETTLKLDHLVRPSVRLGAVVFYSLIGGIAAGALASFWIFVWR